MRKKFWVILLTVLVFISGTILGISAVYRVDDVTVNVSYVTEEAKAEGEKLQKDLEEAYERSSIFFAKENKTQEVLSKYPYFRITSFEKSYPKRLIIGVAEYAELYAIEKTVGEEYFILGADGTVLDIRNTHVNALNGETNVLWKGLTVTAENGSIPTGDECFSTVLNLCNKLSEKLQGIRRNVVSVEVLYRNPETVFCIQMKEGVKIYVKAPQTMTNEKVEAAVNEYLSLASEKKLTGRILITENEGQILHSYSPIDEFAQ